MRIRVEHNGTSFEFERKPMDDGRFRAACKIVGAALYVGLAWIVASICGLFGFVALAIVSLFAFMAYVGF